MKEHEIFITDWTRIFAGDVPPAFYIELALRAAYIFFLLMISMRLLGKRMAAQLSRNEMTALVSLAAAIGVPVLDPERGLLPSTIIAVVVILISKLLAMISFNNKKVEAVTIGDVSILVENGVLNKKSLKQTELPRERIMSQLRSQNILQLGQVKRLYLESTGDFSLVKDPDPQPGLLVLPSSDEEFVQRMVEFTDREICLECGYHLLHSTEHEMICRNCGSREITKAAISK